MDEPKPIGTGLAFTLISFGVMMDFLQGVLALFIIGGLLNSALDLLAMSAFAIMLHHHGGSALKRRVWSYTFTSIAEFMPFINALPLWTIFAIYTVAVDHYRHKWSLPQKESTRPVRGSWRL